MDWETIINTEKKAPYFKALQHFLEEEYQHKTIFPKKSDIFRAFQLTSYDKVKVVLLGQDPYHRAGQACGLSFSVPKGQKIPPSLQNMYKELASDLNVPIPNHGDLESWAKQGVLLLNTVLTVEEGKANAHQGKGWEQFTDHILEALNERSEPIVFLLLGSAAAKKQTLIDTNKHFIVSAPHPSPLSAYRGFFGSHIYSKVNDCLAQAGQTPIQWEIDAM